MDKEIGARCGWRKQLSPLVLRAVVVAAIFVLLTTFVLHYGLRTEEVMAALVPIVKTVFAVGLMAGLTILFVMSMAGLQVTADEVMGENDEWGYEEEDDAEWEMPWVKK